MADAKSSSFDDESHQDHLNHRGDSTGHEDGDAAEPDSIIPPTVLVPAGGYVSDDSFTLEIADAPPRTPVLRAPPVIGDFEIVRELGRGGMGVVYEAVQRSLGRRVALKMLALKGHEDPTDVRRFQNEALAAAQLSHANIVPVFAVGSEDGQYFYAMKLIEGENLARVIRRLKDGCEPHKAGLKAVPERTDDQPSTRNSGRQVVLDSRTSLPFYRAVASLIADAADALQHAHDQGIIHRDIKPSNMILDADGKIWIADFGLAQISNQPELTRTGNAVGTLRYMSPEQVSGRRIFVDHRTDIYSLGASLYEFLCLTPAFDTKDDKALLRQLCFEDPPSIGSRDSSIPDALQIIVGRAMARNPTDRYPTAEEFAADLRSFMVNEPIRAKRPGITTQIRRWVSTHQILTTAFLFLLLTFVLVAMVVSGFTYRMWHQEAEKNRQVEAALLESESMRYLVTAINLLPDNPMEAMGLGRVAAKSLDDVKVNNFLQSAIDANHELLQINTRLRLPNILAVSHGSKLAAVSSTYPNEDKSPQPLIVFDLSEGKEICRISRNGAFESATFSPDGRFLLTTSSSKVAESAANAAASIPELWDPMSGKQLFSFAECRLHSTRADHFSFDSSMLILPGRSHDVLVWNLNDNQVRFRISLDGTQVEDAAFATTGERAAAVDSAGNISIINCKEASSTKIMTGSGDDFSRASIRWSADVNYLLASTVSGSTIVKADDGQPLKSFRNASILALHHDETVIAYGIRHSESVRVSAFSGQNKPVDLACSSLLQALCFSNDGHSLIAATEQGIDVFHLASSPERTSLKGHAGRVLAVATASQSGNIVSTGRDGTLRVWSLRSGLEKRTASKYPILAQQTSASLSPTMNRLSLVCCHSTETLLVDQVTGVEGRAIAGEPLGDRIDSRLGIFTQDDHLNLIRVDKSQTLSSQPLRKHRIRKAEVIPARNAAVLLTERGELLFWDFEPDLMHALFTPASGVRDFDASGDGERVILSLNDGSCILLELNTGNQLILAAVEGDPVAEVCFFPDSTDFAVLRENSGARLHSANLSEYAHLSAEADCSFNDLEISADGEYLYAISRSPMHAVCCWQIATRSRVDVKALDESPHLVPHPTGPGVLLWLKETESVLEWNPESNVYRPIPEEMVVGAAYTDKQIVILQKSAQRSTAPGSNKAEHESDGHAIVKFLDQESLELISSHNIDGRPLSLSRDISSGRVLVTRTVYGFSIWEQGGDFRQSGSFPHLSRVIFGEFTENGERFLTAGANGRVLIQSSQDLRLLNEANLQQQIMCGDINDAGNVVACGLHNGDVALVDALTLKPRSMLPGNGTSVQYVCFSPDNQYLVVQSHDQKLTLWDIRNETSRTLESTLDIASLSWSPDSSQILLVSNQQPADQNPTRLKSFSIALLNAASMDITPVIQEHGHASAALHPKMEVIAVAYLNGKCELRDPKSMAVVRQIDTRRNDALLVAYSPSGAIMAIQHRDEISLWNTQTWNEVHAVHCSAVHRFRLQNALGIAAWNPFLVNESHIWTIENHLMLWPCSPSQQTRRLIPDEQAEQIRLKHSIESRPLSESSQAAFSVERVTGHATTTIADPIKMAADFFQDF